jgi:hypothetical protein
MWVEIITTAVTAAVATHLGPRAYHLLVGKLVRVKAPVKSTEVRLGSYIESVDQSEEGVNFKLRVAPACQKTLLGSSRMPVSNLDPTTQDWEIDLEEDAKFAVIPPDYENKD